MIGDLSFSDQYTRWAARKRSQKCGGGSSRRVNQRQIIEPWKLSAPQSLASGLKIDALHDRFRIDQHSRSCFATGRFACGKKIMAESWSLWIWNLVATARQPSKPQSFAFHTRYHHHHNNNNKWRMTPQDSHFPDESGCSVICYIDVPCFSNRNGDGIPFLSASNHIILGQPPWIKVMCCRLSLSRQEPF